MSRLGGPARCEGPRAVPGTPERGGNVDPGTAGRAESVTREGLRGKLQNREQKPKAPNQTSEKNNKLMTPTFSPQARHGIYSTDNDRLLSLTMQRIWCYVCRYIIHSFNKQLQGHLPDANLVPRDTDSPTNQAEDMATLTESALP